MKKTESKKTKTKKPETKKPETKKPENEETNSRNKKGHFGMVVLVHLPQDTERTIIPYLNKKRNFRRSSK